MGIKIAAPAKDIVCVIGGGSYMMTNSEPATAVMRRIPFTVVLTGNRGYGGINRLQIECGGAEFNNLYKDARVEIQPEIDFVAHARSMGVFAVGARYIPDLEHEIAVARSRGIPTVIVIDTDLAPGAGGHRRDVAVPQVGCRDRRLYRRREARRNHGRSRWRCRAGSGRASSVRSALWLRVVLPERHGGTASQVAFRSGPRRCMVVGTRCLSSPTFASR